MSQTHIIIDNIVTNTIVATVAEAQAAFPDALCLDAEQYPGGIDWTWDGTALHAPEQPAPEPEAPAACTRRQGLLALLSFGIKRSDIETQIGAISDEAEREAALIEYEAATWERDNPFLQAMWASLGGTPEQLDDLFRLAVTL